MNDLEVQRTDDGTATLYVKSLNEHYHSVKGALTEAKHIYRDCALRHHTTHTGTQPIRLLEIGFGTGLNAVVTAMAADATMPPIHYITLEKYPVPTAIIEELNYGSIVDTQLLRDIHTALWEQPVSITPTFTIEKRQCDLLTTPLPSDIDVVYFDAFAPKKQPEMWTPDVFARLYKAMRPEATLTTYCAKGVIRRMLQATGFIVERLAGPIGGKREILRATKG